MNVRWLLPVVVVASLAGAAPAQARHAPPDPQSQNPVANYANAAARALAGIGGLAQHRPAVGLSRAANTNPTTFNDTANDGGSAPDVLTVIAGNDANGTYTFRINVTKLTLPSDVIIFLVMDTDNNPATGTGGFDYVLVCDESDGSVGLLRWDGSALVAASATTLAASDNSTGISASINRSDLGNASALNFEILSVEGPTPSAGHVDVAPDVGVWNYQLTEPAPLTLNVEAFRSPKTVKAGKTFVVTLVVARSDSGAFVNDEIGGTIACQATAAGKRLGLLAAGFVENTDPELAACSWRAPKKARGKTIKGSIAVSVEGVSAKKTFKLTVK